jgi:hypothetical protein
MNMTSRTQKWKFAVLLAAIVAAPATAFAVGEVYGRLGGTITEAQTGAPVPGATVTVSSKALIGGPKTVTTDDTGHYDVADLPPGSYTVEVSYSGVKPIKRRVVIRQGELAPLDVQWSAELAEAEVTVVVEERHMTRPDSTQSGTVITLDQSNKVATNRSYQDIASQVAGVNAVTGGNPSVKGGNLMANRYLVDGLDITDPVTNTFSANMNFDSIASIDVITGGMEAQYNSLGSVINVITAGGSDDWHVDASFYLNNNNFSAQGQYGSQMYEGQTPFSRVKPAPTASYQANLNVSGPILKHRLWFQASYQFSYTEASTPAGPPYNFQPPTRRFLGHFARLKLTWAPNDKHRVTLSASADPAEIDNVTRASALRRLPVAQNRQKQGGVFAILQWDYFINKNINTQVQTGFQYQNIDAGSQGDTAHLGGPGIDPFPPELAGGSPLITDIPGNSVYDFNRPQHVNRTDATIWYQGSAATALDKRYRFQLDPSISLRGRAAGTHDAKIGLQYRWAKSTYDIFNTGRGVSYTDAGGAPGEAGLCNELQGTGGCFLKFVTSDYSQAYSSNAVGVFLQDRWKPHKRITIMPGIRFDWGATNNSVNEKASDLFGVGPRLGVNVDLTGDQKTILLAFYGRANEVGNILPAAYGSPTAITNIYAWDGTGFNQLAATLGGARGYRFDPTATTPPHTDEVLVAIRRELFKNSVGSIEYTYKRVSNMWDWREINTLWDPSGYRQLTDSNGAPLYVDQGSPQQIQLITTNHNLIREYQGVDFVLEARPTPNLDFYTAYTLAFLYGSMGEQFGGQVGTSGSLGALYNPRQTHFWQGYLPEDVRHMLKVRVSYEWRGLTVGAFLNYTSGSPYSMRFFQYAPDGAHVNFRSPIGTAPGLTTQCNGTCPTPTNATNNDPRAFSEFRNPDILTVNLRAQFDFDSLWKKGHHLYLIADLFNLFNLRTPNGLEQQDIPTFGLVTSRIQPFRFQLALRYVY